MEINLEKLTTSWTKYAIVQVMESIDSVTKIESSKKDIRPHSETNFNQLKQHLGSNNFEHTVTSLDHRKCLDKIETGNLVYDDPHFALVHYSRFYHAIETLVKYDYPQVDHKGRYRSDRHQSPFGRKTEVKKAFQALFLGVKNKNSSLILSYSNTGMISLDEIIQIAKDNIGKDYDVSYKEQDYKHSTMGRSGDKNKSVLKISSNYKKEINGK